jgi:hypothetical protein
LLQLTDLEGKIDVDLLADHQGNSSLDFRREARAVRGQLVSPDRKRGRSVAALAIGDDPANSAGFDVRDSNRCGRQPSA